MGVLETELSKLEKNMTLEKSIRDVDILIEQLGKARETIVADPNSAPITLATLQNPLKKGFEQVNEDLVQIHKTYTKYGKSLDKNVPIKALLSEGQTVTMTVNDQPMIDSEELKVEDILRAFLKMYSILDDLKVYNLESAIQWARQNSLQLEQRGSNIEFELCKLQYLWLFHGPEKKWLAR